VLRRGSRCPAAAADGPGSPCAGPIFWYCPSRLEGSSEEEEKDEEEWMAFGQPWDVSSQDSEPPYSLIALRPPFLGEGPRPPPSALEAKLHWLPVPWGHRPTAEVSGPPTRCCSPGCPGRATPQPHLCPPPGGLAALPSARPGPSRSPGRGVGR